jgi:ubiquinone/menaquinone biosynthesis C-methylase UbiE
MQPKPRHLDPRYGGQFEDESVARAYHTRPPYPPELFTVLSTLLPSGATSLLDLGCGTGDISLGMIERASRIDAVDPSEAMLRVARGRKGADAPNISWLHASAEAVQFGALYSLVVAGESLHWMDWELVLPKIARALVPGGFLVIVDGRALDRMPWSADLETLIPRFSTNQEYRHYDLVTELSSRGLFTEIGRRKTSPVPFSQSTDEYIESFHTRNGFSRLRMTAGAAAQFDRELDQLVSAHSAGRMVRGHTIAEVIWGIPTRAGSDGPP